MLLLLGLAQMAWQGCLCAPSLLVVPVLLFWACLGLLLQGGLVYRVVLLLALGLPLSS